MNAFRKKTDEQHDRTGRGTFRRAVLRGLGVVLPPLLTILFFLWIWNSVANYVLGPIETGTRWLVCTIESRNIYKAPPNNEAVFNDEGQTYFVQGDRRFVRLVSGEWIPSKVYESVTLDPGDDVPTTAAGYYRRYVDTQLLRRSFVVPLFLIVFVVFLYLVGRFIAARMGGMIWHTLERLIHQLPIVRTVYGSVKQVTDFVFSEPEFEYTRVIAVEYPRKGIWSLGFITGESLLDICTAAQEPVVTVLIPTSPMPATGYTITCLKSETIDLNISLDQAFQFIVSCGVVVPDPQKHINGRPMFNVPGQLSSSGNASENTDGIATVAGDR